MTRVNLTNMPNLGSSIHIPRLSEEDVSHLLEMGGEQVRSGCVSFPRNRVRGNVWVGFDSPQNGYNEFVVDKAVYCKVYLSGKYQTEISRLVKREEF